MFLEGMVACFCNIIHYWFVLNLSIIYLRRLENIHGVFYTLISVCASVCFSKQIQNLPVHTVVEFDYSFMIQNLLFTKQAVSLKKSLF